MERQSTYEVATLLGFWLLFVLFRGRIVLKRICWSLSPEADGSQILTNAGSISCWTWEKLERDPEISPCLPEPKIQFDREQLQLYSLPGMLEPSKSNEARCIQRITWNLQVLEYSLWIQELINAYSIRVYCSLLPTTMKTHRWDSGHDGDLLQTHIYLG